MDFQRYLDTEGLCSDAERKVIESLAAGVSQRKTADTLGLSRGAISDSLDRVKRKAARLGLAPGHFEHGIAPGYLMGKVTVQRNGNGAVERTWERQHPTAQDALDNIKEAMSEAVRDAKGTFKPVVAPKHYDADLLTLIPMGDPHFGLLTWAQEGGDNFDL